MSRAHADQRRRWPVWAARCLWALVVAALLIHFIPGQGYRSATSEGGLSQVFVTAAVVVFLLAFATVGALVASRVPGNPIGWLLLGSALAYTLAASATVSLGPGSGGPAWYLVVADLASQPLYNAGLALGFLTLLLFPTGSLPSRRWRWAGWLVGAGWLLFTIGQTFGPARLPDLHAANPVSVAGPAGRVLGALQAGEVLAIAGGVLACISLIVRFRRSESVVRKQIEWLAYAAAVVVAGIIVSTLLQLRPQTETLTNYQNGVVTLALASIPVAMGVAILTRRLYDIDVIVNKTVVYLSLAAFITAVYVALVVGIGRGRRPGGQGRASGCRSSRPRWSRWRSSRSVSAFSVWRTAWSTASGPRRTRRCPPSRTSSAPRCRPRSCCRTWPRCSPARPGPHRPRSGCAQATVCGWRPPTRPVTRRQPAPQPIALPPHGLPDFPGTTTAFEVSHGGERLGALTLAKRPGEALTPVERRLAAQLAAQAGLVLRNAGLTEQLKERMAELLASRKRIVEAADGERRRLERNIHDGAQQQLVALAVMAAAGRDHGGQRQGQRAGHVVQAQADAAGALENLRDLARGIYPPLLADQGLVAALEAQARKAPVPVTVEADGVGRYPQEVEAAVYFCALEALQNVAKYAGRDSAATGAPVASRERAPSSSR